jgi:hypothetical protein
MLPMELPPEPNLQQVLLQRWEALGYNKPLLTQYGIYLKNIFTAWDFGTSWKIDQLTPAWDLLVGRLTPTVLVNLYSQTDASGAVCLIHHHHRLLYAGADAAYGAAAGTQSAAGAAAAVGSPGLQ